MYIVDELGEALSEDCICLYILGKKPPWQPDAGARLGDFLQSEFALLANVAELVSQFTHEWWKT